MLEATKRKIYFALGCFFTLMGFIGLFLPIFPTAPFIIVAVYFFSQSSQKFHDWLWHHPQLGPPVRDWYDHRVIRPKAKILSCVMISISFSLTITFVPVHYGVKISVAVLGLAIILFIVTRKSER